MAAEIRVKRVYDPPARSDGTRILVDRIWPRGFSKQKVAIDHWVKDVAPSTDLRRWFGHDPDKWTEFRRRYAAELAERPEALQALRALCGGGVVTLVYAARDEAHNNAVALRQFLAKPGRGAAGG